jgi:replicative DNA helicase
MLPPDAVPESLEAEQSVLGALLLDGTALDRIAGLRPEHFARAEHRAIYQAVLDCTEDDGAVDVVTVAERLKRNGAAGDDIVAYLGALAQNTPGAINAHRYADLVRERALERRLLAALSDAGDLVRNSVLPAREKLDQVQAKVMAVTEATSREPIHVGEAWASYSEALAQRGTKDIKGVQTHFADLDRRIGTLRRGELTVIAGRPAMGKSALAFQLAERAAWGGHPTLVLSMEMTREQVLDRLVSGVTRIPVEKLISGERATDPDVGAARGTISRWPLYLDDSPALTLLEVRAKARAVKRRHGLELLVIDYLQLMAGAGETRNAVVEEISRGLKALAKELQAPVVAVSQLSRKCEERADRRPMLSDLRDSGAIEQDADLVMFVYREQEYRPHAVEWHGLAELLIRKNRQGQTGDVRLCWRGALTRFEDLAAEATWPSSRAGAQPRRRAFGE